MKEFKKKLNSNRAITLIALIITIITMLILVGTSVSLVIDSDLIGVAEDAANRTETAYGNEAGMSGVSIGDKTYNSIEEYLADQGGQTPPADEPEGGDGDGEGNGTTLPENAGTKYDENGEYFDGTNTAMIPAKFTVSGAPTECTISEGLVIYLIDDKTDAEIEAIDWTDAITLATLQESYDQFVWIPIKNTTDANAQDINDMYICQNKGTGSYGTAACVITVPEATGVATCSTHGNCTAMAGRLYATGAGTAFEQNYTETYASESGGLREPDTVENSSYDGDSTNRGYITSILGTSYSSASALKTDLQTEYNAVVKSVYLNQGFYVGRYETSNITTTNGTSITVQAGKTPSNATNGINWYYMYAQQRDYASNNSLAAGSTMIQGAAYDQVMKFVNTENYSVTTKGNVGHTSSEFTTTPYQTGGRDYSTNYSGTVTYNDVSKNIYDLEGNVYAWTTEAAATYDRISRGGTFSNNYNAGCRNNFMPPTASGAVIGSICQLYVK